MRLYSYVGPKRIADRVPAAPPGIPIHTVEDVRAWVRNSRQELCADCVIATFVVDASGRLLVADRRSEHVACAGGQRVRSAGEITFAVGRGVEVIEVSNQSTGYCPEPESWPAVAEALGRAGLTAPKGFGLVCVFRRCNACGGVTVVKDAVFVCDICGGELPLTYNVQPATQTSPASPA
jgi:hypothetical protein